MKRTLFSTARSTRRWPRARIEAEDRDNLWEQLTDYDNIASEERAEVLFRPQSSPSPQAEIVVSNGDEALDDEGGATQEQGDTEVYDELINGLEEQEAAQDNTIQDFGDDAAKAKLPVKDVPRIDTTAVYSETDPEQPTVAIKRENEQATKKTTEKMAEPDTEKDTNRASGRPPEQEMAPAAEHDADAPLPTIEIEMEDDEIELPPQKEVRRRRTRRDDDDDDDEEEDEYEDDRTTSYASTPLPDSSIEVVLEPLPSDRRSEFEETVPSNYVHRIVRRTRGSDNDVRLEVEYDDGRRRKLPANIVVRLSSGRRALYDLEHADEDEDELAWEIGAKRRKTAHEAAQRSSFRSMDIDASPDDLSLEAPESPQSPESSSQDDMSGRNADGDSRRTLRRRRRPITRQAGPAIRGGRQLRPRVPTKRQPSSKSATQDSDKDELQTDDELFIHPVISNIQPTRMRPRRGFGRRRPGGAMRAVRDSSQDDDTIEFVENRRSSRTNRNTRNMAELGNIDDDFSASEKERAPIVPRTVNIHEVFQPAEDGPFQRAHAPLCSSCNRPARVPNKGVFIHCQGCSLSFHKMCIGIRNVRDHIVTKVAPDSFVLQCRFCVGYAKAKDPLAPNLDRCQACHEPGRSCAAFSEKKTAKQEEKLRQDNEGVDPITPVATGLVNNADNVLFRCTGCRRAFHYEHLPSPSPAWVDNEGADVREERWAEYSIEWKCRTCLEMPAKVEGLVAWRPAAGQGASPDHDVSDVEEEAKEYLVKWHEKSHAHCEWKPGSWVWGVTHARMRLAFAKAGMPPTFEAADAIPEEYLLADIIFSVRYKQNAAASKSKKADLARIGDVSEVMVKFQGLGYDAIVWDEPPPRDSGKRWRTFSMAYDEFLNGKHFKADTLQNIRQRMADFQSRKKFEIVKKQPGFLRRGELMPYQMDGLNWLLLNYYKGKSVVLADEMGLGKTVQVVALLAMLVLEVPRCWPFLVVVPNSTCPNWRREIKTWAPDLRVVTYHGGRQAQQFARDYELFPDHAGGQNMRAHVVIMSYDSAQDDATRRYFGHVHWAGLVVDEGQRLKNDQNLLYLALRAMRISFRLLLTGTPLQNNKRELFNLLQFIDSSNDAAALDETYREVTAENLPQLHKLIRPYFLRRTKAEVLKFLPPMAQIIVPVSMTVVQEKLYKSILAKNSNLIQAIFTKGRMRAAERGSLNNILMQLRKCLCHPFVYSEAIEDKTVDADTMQRNLIEASSKLMLLKIMLPKLQERGHRVLLFSQFLHQLSIVEDFLQFLGLRYERLDGNLSSLEKQKRIDAFNAPDSDLFAFLLSTRAGGVGINLATADTVIVLDPDFNPHQDIQAFSRAHRIGQKKKVLCFQLMTKDSVEEKIMQMGRKKMALDHALIESMDAEDDVSNDLESILQHGAKALFSGKGERIVYDSSSVDRLLDRSQVENTKTDAEHTAESQFSFARVWANETGSLTDDIEITEGGDGAYNTWEAIIKEREAEAEAARLAIAEQEQLGRGQRRRAKRDTGYLLPRYSEAEGDTAQDGHGADLFLPSDGPDVKNDDDRDGEFSVRPPGGGGSDGDDDGDDSSSYDEGEPAAALDELRGAGRAAGRAASRAIRGASQAGTPDHEGAQGTKPDGPDKNGDSDGAPGSKRRNHHVSGRTGSALPVGPQLRGDQPNTDPMQQQHHQQPQQQQCQDQQRQQQQQSPQQQQEKDRQQQWQQRWQQEQRELQEQQQHARQKTEQYNAQRWLRRQQKRQLEEHGQQQQQHQQQQQLQHQYEQQLQYEQQQQQHQLQHQYEQQQQHHLLTLQHLGVRLDEAQRKHWDFLVHGEHVMQQRIAELTAPQHAHQRAAAAHRAAVGGDGAVVPPVANGSAGPSPFLDGHIRDAYKRLEHIRSIEREFLRRVRAEQQPPAGPGAVAEPGGSGGGGGRRPDGRAHYAEGGGSGEWWTSSLGGNGNGTGNGNHGSRGTDGLAAVAEGLGVVALPPSPPAPPAAAPRAPRPQQQRPLPPPEASGRAPAAGAPGTGRSSRGMELVIALEERPGGPWQEQPAPAPKQKQHHQQQQLLLQQQASRSVCRSVEVLDAPPCARCRTLHAVGAACPNLRTEAGIRLALDSLPADKTALDETRRELVARLRDLVQQRRRG